MTREALFTIIPAAVLLSGALFANQAAAFGISGAFPADALSSLLSPPPAVSQAATAPVPLPGN